MKNEKNIIAVCDDEANKELRKLDTDEVFENEKANALTELILAITDEYSEVTPDEAFSKYWEILPRKFSDDEVQNLKYEIIIFATLIFGKFKEKLGIYLAEKTLITSITMADKIKSVTDGEILLRQLTYNYREHMLNSRDNGKFGDCINYVNRHINADLSLKALAEIFNYNPTYFSHKFKQETGVCLSEYIINRKLSVAATLAISSTKPLKEIASLVGFSDQSYFSRAFTAKYGISPMKYRNTMKEKISRKD